MRDQIVCLYVLQHMAVTTGPTEREPPQPAIAPHSACSIVREAKRTPLSPILAIVNDRLAVAPARPPSLPTLLTAKHRFCPMSFTPRESRKGLDASPVSL